MIWYLVFYDDDHDHDDDDQDDDDYKVDDFTSQPLQLPLIPSSMHSPTDQVEFDTMIMIHDH